MIDATDPSFDPMILVAANRGMVRLKNGMCAKLIWWSKVDDTAVLHFNRMNVPCKKSDIEAVVQRAEP